MQSRHNSLNKKFSTSKKISKSLVKFHNDGTIRKNKPFRRNNPKGV